MKNGRRRVLLVEDNRADVFLFEEALRSHGLACDVVHVQDGSEALLHLASAEKRPDLIVLDLNLPRVGGSEVLREIRGDPLLVEVPIVVVSGAAREHSGPVDGASAYIHKTMDVAKLFADIAGAVARLCPPPPA